jgi:asparagine synthase (glutamine-hydrolysing)
LGDFAFGIWDAGKQQLFCCRDHMGTYALFYYTDATKFVVSTNINVILATEGVPNKLNEQQMVRFVVPAAKHLSWSDTWFEHIHKLPAGSYCIVNKKGMRQQSYWKPEIGLELRFKNELEYTEAFQDILFKAVGDRIKSPFPITALLSGGLDSSSVVAVAAKILERQNRVLHTFSSVLPDENDNILKDERYYIDQFKPVFNIQMNYITAPNRGFFSTLSDISASWTTPLLSPQYYLYQTFTQEAMALGSKTILEGGGGELGATSYAEGGYAEMFLKGHWVSLWQELKARKQRSGGSINRSIFSQVIRPLLPILQYDTGSTTKMVDTHCFTPAYTQHLQTMLAPRHKDLKVMAHSILPNHRQNQLETLRLIQKKSHGNDVFPVGYLYPLMDKRLLEFCLNLPLDLKIKNGYQRYTIRAGMDKLLPPEIQWRTSKTPFSPDYIRRYNREKGEVLAYLEDIRSNDPIHTIMDIEKLKRWVQLPVDDNEPRGKNYDIALNWVPQNIYLIHFLRRFSAFKN